MNDERDKPRVHAENNSIAIGEINISGTVTGNISIGHTIIQAADAQLQHDLGILLKNVQTTWIKGVLERSVHEAALLDLGMEIREEAVDNPWRLVMEAPDQTRETLPRGKRIEDIFYEANGLLLILGEPGSGKTTTLLQLARDLIAEVDQEFTHPVPVILNLSTWTNKEQPLNKWLVEELNSKYRVPKKDGQRWLEGRRILPLLDGLDEVKAENRVACVEKINQLVKDYGLQAVVCSRIQDYAALNVRLGFYRAIYIQPLTSEQVDEYLKSAGDKLASLRATLQADEALKAMAQSPLILNIMSLAYQNTSAETLSDPTLNTNETRRRHLFDTYIARMFKRKAGERPHSDEQTKGWLSWLARNMERHNHDTFLIENLQPSWLSTRRWRWTYFLVSRLIFGLIFMPFFGLQGAMLFGLPTVVGAGFVDALRFEWLNRRSSKSPPTGFWWPVFNIFAVGLGIELVSAFVSVPVIVIGTFLRRDSSTIIDFPVAGTINASTFLLVGVLILGLRGSSQTLDSDIRTTEILHWSWHKALKGGLTCGPLAGLGMVLIYGLYALLGEGWEGMLIEARGITLWSLMVFLMIGTIFSGLNREIVETKSVPNQGIRLSMRNAIYSGIIIFPMVGFIVWLVSILTLTKPFNYVEVLIFSIGVGIAAALSGVCWFGGIDVVQHYVLRLTLILRRHIPTNYARFLDYAVDRIFLQKVGGGYRFIHRLLLEHFAEMDELKKV